MERKLKRWKQKGYNCLFPPVIEVWKWGEPVPEWLSDRAAIQFIDGEGNITLKTRGISKGGFEVIEAGTGEALVRVGSKEDYIYFPITTELKNCPAPPGSEPWKLNPGEKIIGSLTPTQLHLIYTKDEKRR